MTSPSPAIAGYRDFELIGEGGFGRVYRATQDITERVVAIKVLDRVGHDNKAQDSFKREARAMTELSKVEHVVDVYDARFADSGEPYLVMAYFAGGSLADQLQVNGPLPVDNVIEIGEAIARALDQAHRRGIAHRDLKPDNILVDEDGDIALTDFGLAVTEETTLRGDSRFMMTPEHTPPERLEGPEGHTADPYLADIYSLGSTLYTLLEGHPPFGTEASLGTAEFTRRIVHEPLPRLSGSDQPPGLQAVLDRALAKSPTDRYQSASELAGAIHSVPHGEVRPLQPIRGRRLPGPGSGIEPGPAPIVPPVPTAGASEEPTRIRGGAVPPPPPPAADAGSGIVEAAQPTPKLTSSSEPTIVRTRAEVDSVPELAVDAPKSANTGLIVGGAAAALLVVGVLAFVLTRPGTDTATTPSTTTKPPVATVVTEAEAPTVDSVRAMADGGISFTWSYSPDTTDQPSVGYQLYVDGTRAGPPGSIDTDASGLPLHEQVLAAADVEASLPTFDPASSDVCVEVFLLLDTGISDRSDQTCLESAP